MRTPKDFDYDLWTTKENLCMVRVKATGEECEVSRETFRLLRAEEEKLKKGRKSNKALFVEERNQTMLSVDIVPEDDGNPSAWTVDPTDFTEEIITSQTLQTFRQHLTQRQLDVLDRCLLGELNLREYAMTEGLNYRTVWDIREAIRRKFSKF